MTYKEIKANLFDVGDDYALAHCVSADFGMGKGIVIEFNRRFDMKNHLLRKYPYYYKEWVDNKREHGCLFELNVFNLITKEHYWHKPTYSSIRGALEDMKIECLLHNIQKVAMPKIGCGLDRLEWNKVRDIIFDVFADTAIDIKVCYL